jgi:hypothetical protein
MKRWEKALLLASLAVDKEVFCKTSSNLRITKQAAAARPEPSLRRQEKARMRKHRAGRCDMIKKSKERSGLSKSA